jgi:hypothetical protein
VSGKATRQFSPPHTNTETLAPVVWDLRRLQGRQVFLRVIDEQPGGAWGHVNFDDFKFYAQKPAF